MEIKDLIKFEPVDITHIIITITLVVIVIFAFKSQLNAFFETLQDRPITVKMSGSETTIELDAPVKPELIAQSVANPQGSQTELDDWEQTVQYVNTIDGFQKLGFNDLYQKLAALGEGEWAVINYLVDDPTKRYFNDEAMLKYLSIASDKIRYLAFYKNSQFVAAISIENVISGLAAKRYEFSQFGDKIKNGQWRNFPFLITREKSFEATPTVKQLHNQLIATKLMEIPLLENNKLIGFLNYKSISDELYTQVSKG